jgi:hypothetical protein
MRSFFTAAVAAFGGLLPFCGTLLLDADSYPACA